MAPWFCFPILFVLGILAFPFFVARFFSQHFKDRE
jgi:hypothetical protein